MLRWVAAAVGRLLSETGSKRAPECRLWAGEMLSRLTGAHRLPPAGPCPTCPYARHIGTLHLGDTGKVTATGNYCHGEREPYTSIAEMP